MVVVTDLTTWLGDDRALVVKMIFANTKLQIDFALTSLPLHHKIQAITTIN